MFNSNSVVGNQENQAFVIDTIAPIFGSPILLGEDDTGEIKENISLIKILQIIL